MLKVASTDIYKPPLTGKPAQQRFTGTIRNVRIMTFVISLYFVVHIVLTHNFKLLGLT